MKQTAVEWFAEQEIQLTIDFAQKKINNVEYGIRKLRLIDQAKEMEKEHIIEAHNKGVKNGIKFYIESELGDDTGYISGIDYYNETFKSE